MTIKITRFDASEYLDSTEDHVELLNDALETKNPRVVVHALGVIARARGMSELAKTTGLGRSTLYKAVADDANPTMETFMALIDALQIDLSARAQREPAAA